MKTLNILIIVALFFSMFTQKVAAQDSSYKSKIETLKAQKDQIAFQEKEALKIEIEEINKRLDDNDISSGKAKTLKEVAAKKRALNIEDRIAIIDNKIALLERNDGNVLESKIIDSTGLKSFEISIDFKDGDGSSLIWRHKEKAEKELRYDRRTFSDFVLAIGLNNTLSDGRSLEDTPYKVGGSRFFEIGWQWRTRVFKNSNFMRLNYGVSFQYNGLKPKGNQYFAVNDGQTELADFEYDLRKSKLRTDNLVFPVHFEFGPSRLHKNDKSMRYSLTDQFRIGFGGYGGFNMSTRQKLKYDRVGENVKDKLKRGYNTTSFVYGLSGYIGFDGVLLYAKYDLNPLFKDAVVDQHNISLGLRFDL